jgi:hypothetical protein
MEIPICVLSIPQFTKAVFQISWHPTKYWFMDDDDSQYIHIYIIIYIDSILASIAPYIIQTLCSQRKIFKILCKRAKEGIFGTSERKTS